MKILLADDHALFRAGMRHVLAQLAQDVQIIEAADCEQALQAVASQDDVSLVLLDLHMPGRDGFAALEVFSRQYPALPIVVLSASEDRADMRRALDGGAMGFIPKSSTAPILVNALQLVLAGGMYIPPALLQAPFSKDSSETIQTTQSLGLTPRQLDVLGLVIEGLSNKVIAAELEVSEATVKAHITAVFKTLNVTNRTQAALAVERMGLRFPRKS